MEAIKKVFSPGSSRDDEVMYGDPATRAANAQNTSTTNEEPAKLYPVDGAAGQKESGGVLSQITNPSGSKYDETRYGTTATSDPDPNQLYTDTSSKDHTVLSQLTNPGGKKYDEQRYGDTAATVGTASGPTERATDTADVTGVDPNARLESSSDAKSHSILRQIINPGGRKADDISYGSTAAVVGGTTDSSAAPKYNEPQADVLNRSHPLRDGSGAETAYINPVGAPQTGAVDSTSSDHYGRDAAVLGTGAAATGGLAYADRAPATNTSSTIGGPEYSAGQTTSVAAGGLTSSSRDTTAGAIHPNTAQVDCDGNPTEGYLHHVGGPHSTDIANQLDPRVGGGSLATSGATDTSRSHRDEAAVLGGGAALGTTAAVADEKRDLPVRESKETPTTKEEPEKKESFIHKILHPGSKKDKDSETSDSKTAVADDGHNKLHKDPPVGYNAIGDADRRTDPHTGLPINLSKSDGAGGTDASPQIQGYSDSQVKEQAAAGPDWEAIKKGNTLY